MAGGRLGSLTFDITADTAKLRGDISRASREISLGAEQIARATKIAFAGAATGIAAITAETLSAAGEIENLARVANTSAEQFQRYAAGATALGVSQEKLADIFKDTSDRVGDFLTTGGGPLADFFEQIAPKVGVTADQFARLSGPEALQLYVDSLEAANVNQNELVFFLEAIAGDASALIPLLRDGGDGFRAFGEEAARAGAIINDETLEASRRVKADLLIIQEQFKGFRIQIASQVIPVLADLSAAFNSAEINTADFANESTVLEDTLRFIVSRAAAAAGAIDLLAKSIGGAVAVFGALGRQGDEGFFSTEPLKRAAKVAEEFKIDLDATAQSYSDLIKKLEAGGSSDATDRLQAIRDALSAADRPAAGALPGANSNEAAEAQAEAERIRDSLMKRGQAIARSVLTEEEKFARSKSELDELLQESAISQETYNRALAQYRDILNETANAERDSLAADLGGVEDSLLTQEERLADSFARRQQIVDRALEERLISEERAGQLTLELMTQQQQQMEQAQAATLAVQLNNYQSLFDGLAGVAEAFGGRQSGVYRALFAASKAFAVAESIVKIQQGLANASALPFPANIGAMATVAANTASIISTIQSTQMQSFDGGGFTGSGPRIGGLDGRGGFMAMLHPNETVIDHTRGGMVASPTVNVYTQGGTVDDRSVQQIQQGVYRAMVRASARNA